MRTAGRLLFDAALLAAGFFLVASGVRDLFGNDMTDGLVQIALAAIVLRVAGLRLASDMTGTKRRPRSLDALIFLVIFTFFGSLEIIDAARAGEGARAALHGVAAAFIFLVLAFGVSAWWRARTRRQL